GDGAARAVTAQHTHDAGATEPGADLELGGVQALGDDLGRPALLAGPLGVAMKVAAQGHHPLTAAVELLGPLGRDRLHEDHDSLPSTPCQGAAGAARRRLARTSEAESHLPASAAGGSQ